jgi:hypothetical protein
MKNLYKTIGTFRLPGRHITHTYKKGIEELGNYEKLFVPLPSIIGELDEYDTTNSFSRGCFHA